MVISGPVDPVFMAFGHVRMMASGRSYRKLIGELWVFLFLSVNFYLIILWATPSAAGPRPLLIALGLQILGIAASGSWLFWYTNLLFRMIGSFTLVSWGTLGFFGTLGSITMDTLSPGLDFYRFLVDFVAHGCYLACLVPLLWRPGGPWDDPGTILGHWRTQGRTLWGPGLDFTDFCWFRGPFLRVCWVLVDQKRRFFHIYFQVAFSDDFWVWIWVSGIAKTGIWQGRYCKNQLSQKLELVWFQGRFFMILGGPSQILSPEWVGGDWSFFWVQWTIQQDLRHETWEMKDWPFIGSQIWKYKKSRL